MKKILIFVGFPLVLLGGVIFAFLYQRDDGWAEYSFLVDSHFPVLQRWSDLMVKELWKIPRPERSFYGFVLGNDGKPYTLDLQLEPKMVAGGILGEFENMFGKKFYLAYNDHRFDVAYSAFIKSDTLDFQLFLDPNSREFSTRDMACWWFNEKRTCLFAGKLKRRILFFSPANWTEEKHAIKIH